MRRVLALLDGERRRREQSRGTQTAVRVTGAFALKRRRAEKRSRYDRTPVDASARECPNRDSPLTI